MNKSIDTGGNRPETLMDRGLFRLEILKLCYRKDLTEEQNIAMVKKLEEHILDYHHEIKTEPPKAQAKGGKANVENPFKN